MTSSLCINDFGCTSGRPIKGPANESKGTTPNWTTINTDPPPYLRQNCERAFLCTKGRYVFHTCRPPSEPDDRRKKIVYYRTDRRLANCLPTDTHRSGSSHRKRGSPRSWMAPKKEYCVGDVPYGRKFTFSQTTPSSLSSFWYNFFFIIIAWSFFF